MTLIHSIGIDHKTYPLKVQIKGPMLICLFFFEKVNTEENPFILSLYQPRTSREYCLCILAMFTMSSKDLKHVNRPILGMC